jgi:hypothetical protein
MTLHYYTGRRLTNAAEFRRTAERIAVASSALLGMVAVLLGGTTAIVALRGGATPHASAIAAAQAGAILAGLMTMALTVLGYTLGAQPTIQALVHHKELWPAAHLPVRAMPSIGALCGFLAGIGLAVAVILLGVGTGILISIDTT